MNNSSLAALLFSKVFSRGRPFTAPRKYHHPQQVSYHYFTLSYLLLSTLTSLSFPSAGLEPGYDASTVPSRPAIKFSLYFTFSVLDL